MRSTNIACAQIDCVIGDPETNLTKIVSSIRSAAERDAKLVMFPECALTGYAYGSLDEAIPIAESIDGHSSQTISEACRETGAYAVVAWLLIQIVSTVAPIFELPAWIPRVVILLLAIGFPVALIFTLIQRPSAESGTRTILWDWPRTALPHISTINRREICSCSLRKTR